MKDFILILVLWSIFGCGQDNKEIETKYYPDGKVKEIIVSKTKEGIVCHRIFYENEKVKQEYCTLNNKVQGTVNFYNETGDLIQIEHYNDGLENGEFKSFYPDGSIKETSVFKNGLQDGEHRYFYPNGKLRAFHVFEKGTAYYFKILNYNEKDSLVSINEEIYPIATIDDTIIINEEFTISVKLPEVKGCDFNFENMYMKYSFVETSEEYKEKGYPRPIFEVPMVNNVARDSGRMEEVGKFTLYGHVSYMTNMRKDTMLGSFEKNFEIIGIPTDEINM